MKFNDFQKNSRFNIIYPRALYVQGILKQCDENGKAAENSV